MHHKSSAMILDFGIYQYLAKNFLFLFIIDNIYIIIVIFMILNSFYQMRISNLKSIIFI